MEIPEDLSSLSSKQLDNLKKLIEWRNCRIEFARDHHRNTHGEPMDFEGFPHIKDLYNTISPSIAVMGSVQCAKSEWLIIDHLAAANVGLSVFFVLPKHDMKVTYVQNRVNRCVESVPEYKKIMGGGFFDSVALKYFGKGVIKYVGSNVLADFREFPAQVSIVEELDECSAENIPKAEDRLKGSKYQFRRWIGNPSIEKYGIHEKFLKGTQKEWAVPCLDCGNFIELDWFKVVVKEVVDSAGNVVSYKLRDTEWDVTSKRDIQCRCTKCGGVLDRISSEGKWISHNPGADIDSYHISMLCSQMNSIGGMWSTFMEALEDPAKLQHFYNSMLGLPFSSAGYRITRQILDSCVKKGYTLQSQPSEAYTSSDTVTKHCSMGIDVGATLDLRISERVGPDKRRIVYVGKVPSTRYEQIYDLMSQYNVKKCVIDAAPELLLAKQIQEHAPCDVWLCSYGGSEGSDRRVTEDTKNRRITIDRTEALDKSFAAYKNKKVVIPENYNTIVSEEFVEEMCGPVRQLQLDARGNPKYTWTKCKDHQRHADSYDLLAFEMLSYSRIDAEIL